MPALSSMTDLIRSERAALVHAARREGVGPEDAVECAQEALLAFAGLLLRDAVPVERGLWGAYVTTMARNVARNRRRRRHLALHHEPVDGLCDERPGPDELVARAEEHGRLRACVARLCGSQRSVVTLRMLEERPGEDVAALLGISRGHVDVLLHRAKASLRACLAE